MDRRYTTAQAELGTVDDKQMAMKVVASNEQVLAQSDNNGGSNGKGVVDDAADVALGGSAGI